MPTGGGTLQPENQTPDTTTNNMFAVIMDPKRFVEDSYMKHEVDAMIAYAKACCRPTRTHRSWSRASRNASSAPP